MKVLVLGCSGLIGHKLFDELSCQFEMFGTLRRSKEEYGNVDLFQTDNVIEKVDVNDFDLLISYLESINPQVILNCIGITKRKIGANDILEALLINSVFPHRLADWAAENGKRVIHFSTDCVFDGKVGDYSEESLTTAEDVYGRTKALGEIDYPHTLTIRSSFVGRELFSHTEILDWFLSTKDDPIRGFSKALYSGVSTIYMCRVILRLILEYPNLSGLRQLSIGNPITKFELLGYAKRAFETDGEIMPDDNFSIRPTLNGKLLAAEMGLCPPDWQSMMTELASDPFVYPDLVNNNKPNGLS